MSATFKIAFDGGLREGFDAQQVTQVLVSRFRMSDEKARMLFSGGRVILKKGLSAAQAKQYVTQLGAAGLELRAISEAVGGVPPSAAAAPAYRVIYAGGLLPGVTREQVQAAARVRLRLNDGQVKSVFSGRELGLKKGLDEAGARRYLALLREIGMDVRCDPALPGAVEAPPEAPPAVVMAPVSPDRPAAVQSEEDAAEAQFKETAFWEDPLAQQNDIDNIDEVDRRLMEAMAADFDIPSTPQPVDPSVPSLEGTDLGNATRHLAETMLNADALRSYENEIAEAENRYRQDETVPLPADAPTLDRYGSPTAEPADDEYALQRTIVVVRDRAEDALAAAPVAPAPAPAVPPASAAPAPVDAPLPPAATADLADAGAPDAADEIGTALACDRKRQILVVAAAAAAVVAVVLLLLA